MHDTEANQLIKKALILETNQRTEFLNQLEEGELKQKITFLLNDDVELTQFILKTSHGTKGLTLQHIGDLKPGDKINQFIIVKLIAKGGMGSVYLAYDEKLKRNVAIKTIRSEYLKNHATQQRFMQEAQILSQINHPSICQIYDYIDYEDGDLLVLELVDGITLSNIDLSDSEKLDTFIQIASALVAAHNKDVIHRDLKPDNIMRTDERKIKVLDFGIAKSNVVDDTLDKDIIDNDNQKLTKMGTMMGTLLYMSPEQAEGKEITKASDIYSFGIIMQEMLTGVTVYDLANTKDLKEQVINAETINSELIPKKYRKLIASIALKYPLQRPTAIEVLSILREIKELPKKRLRSFFIISVILLSLMGFGKYTYDLKQQKIQAETAQAQAEQAKSESEKVTEFLESLFNVSDPYTNNGKTITARQMLDDGAKRIDQELTEQPRVLIKLKIIIANVYRQLGLYDHSRKQFNMANKLFDQQQIKDSDLKINLLRMQSLLEVNIGDYNLASTLLETVLSIAQQDGYKGNYNYLDIEYDLAVVRFKLGQYHEASIIYNKQLKLYSKNKIENKANLIELYNSKGMVSWKLDELDKAESLMKKALSLFTEPGSKSESTEIRLSILNNLMNVTGGAGKYKEAIEYGLENIETREKILGENHPTVALSYDNLAIVYYHDKQVKKSIELNAKALAIYAATTGKNNIDYAFTLGNRAGILSNNEKYDEAIISLIEATSILKKIHGKDNNDTAYYLTSLGKAYYYNEDYKNAITTLEAARQMYDNLLYPLTNDVVNTLTKLAQAYDKNKDKNTALKVYTQLLEMLKEQNKNTKAIENIQNKIQKLNENLIINQ